MDGDFTKHVVASLVIVTTLSGSAAVRTSSCGTEKINCRKYNISCETGKQIRIKDGFYVMKSDALKCPQELDSCQNDLTVNNCCKETASKEKIKFTDEIEILVQKCNLKRECDIYYFNSSQYVLSVVVYSCISDMTVDGPDASDPTNTAEIAVGSVTAILIVITILVFLFCLRKRLKKTLWRRSEGIAYQDPVASYDYVTVEDPGRSKESGLVIENSSQMTQEVYNRLGEKNVKVSNIHDTPAPVSNHYDTPASAAQRLEGLVHKAAATGTKDDVTYSYNHLKDKDQARGHGNNYDTVTSPGKVLRSLAVPEGSDSTYDTSGTSGPQITIQNVYAIASIHNSKSGEGLSGNEPVQIDYAVNSTSDLQDESRTNDEVMPSDYDINDQERVVQAKKITEINLEYDVPGSVYSRAGQTQITDNRPFQFVQQNSAVGNTYDVPRSLSKTPFNNRNVPNSKIPVLCKKH